MMSTARRHPPQCGRSAHRRRQHPLLPPSLLLLVASAFCWKGAAGQQIGCGGSYFIKYSASTESFFDALSGDGVDFSALRSNDCKSALPGFNVVLAHLHGDAAGDPPTMACNNDYNTLEFDGGSAGCTAGVTLFNDKLNSGTIDALLATAGLLDDATESKSFDEKLTIWAREVPVDAYLEKAQANFQPFTPASISEKVQYATTLAAFEATGPSNAAVHEVFRRLLAMEDVAKTAHDNNAILDRLTTLEETKATQDQKIADLEAALQSKASTTYVAGMFAEVDAQLVRIEGIRRERAADAAAAAAAAASSKTPGTAGSNTGQQAGIDDQPTAAPNPAGPATEDGNNPPGAGGGQDGPCPDQQDPPECAAISPAGCGTLIGQTNVTAVCPNLCSANCNAAAAGTGGGDDGDEKSSKLTVGRILAIALSLLTVVVCGCVAVVLTMRKKEQGRQRALTHKRRAPAATNNPTFTVGDGELPTTAPISHPMGVHDAAAAVGNSLANGGGSINNGTAAATYSTAVETGDVIYVADGGGGGGGGEREGHGAGGGGGGSISAPNASQQPAVVYSVPHANRAAGGGRSNAEEARYSGYEPPPATGSTASAAAGSEIVYAVAVEDAADGARVVARMPNPLYQPADGPSADTRTLVRLPNPLYEPASNNMYDAGVISTSTSTSTSTSNSNA